MKANSYKMKKLNIIVFQSKKTSLKSAIIQNMSYVYQKNVKHDKNQKLVYIFLQKTRVKASKVITNFLKAINFVHVRLASMLMGSYMTCK